MILGVLEEESGVELRRFCWRGGGGVSGSIHSVLIKREKERGRRKWREREISSHLFRGLSEQKIKEEKSKDVSESIWAFFSHSLPDHPLPRPLATSTGSHFTVSQYPGSNQLVHTAWISHCDFYEETCRNACELY